MKLLGLIILALCSVLLGECFAQYYSHRAVLIAVTVRVLLEFELIMEFRSPVVPEIITEIKHSIDKLPGFLDSTGDGADARMVVEILEHNPDNYSVSDKNKLLEFFSMLGNNDRSGELKKIRAVRGYFEERCRAERDESEKKIRLSHAFGLLGGVFLFVMLI